MEFRKRFRNYTNTIRNYFTYADCIRLPINKPLSDFLDQEIAIHRVVVVVVVVVVVGGDALQKSYRQSPSFQIGSGFGMKFGRIY